jgi:HAAS
VVGLTDDLIARYLAQLKAGLRTTPERAGQILAEAEDHLRESAAAGEAMGITERDAQEAAIAAFGGARAIARAHRRPVAAALAEAGMAAMKLGAVYLLTVSAIGWSAVLLEKMARRIPVSPGTKIVLAPVGYTRTIEVLTVLAAIGLALLAGYRLARRWRAAGALAPPGELLGGFFPLVAMICMLIVVLCVLPLLRTLTFPGEGLASAPGIPASVTFGGAAVAIGYAIQMARILLRQRDSGAAAGERIPHAG